MASQKVKIGVQEYPTEVNSVLNQRAPKESPYFILGKYSDNLKLYANNVLNFNFPNDVNMNRLDPVDKDTDVSQNLKEYAREVNEQIERLNIVQMLKIGRRVQAHENNCGELQRQGRARIESLTILPSKNMQLYGIIVIGILHLAWISSMSLLPSTACQTQFLVKATKDPVALYFLYWLPAFCHLISIVWSFNWPVKLTWFISLALGFSAFIWQLVCMIMFFVQPQWTDATSALSASWAELVLWWLDLFPLVAIILGQLDIVMTQGAFEHVSSQMLQHIEQVRYPELAHAWVSELGDTRQNTVFTKEIFRMQQQVLEYQAKAAPMYLQDVKSLAQIAAQTVLDEEPSYAKSSFIELYEMNPIQRKVGGPQMVNQDYAVPQRDHLKTREQIYNNMPTQPVIPGRSVPANIEEMYKLKHQ